MSNVIRLPDLTDGPTFQPLHMLSGTLPNNRNARHPRPTPMLRFRRSTARAVLGLAVRANTFRNLDGASNATSLPANHAPTLNTHTPHNNAMNTEFARCPVCLALFLSAFLSFLSAFSRLVRKPGYRWHSLDEHLIITSDATPMNLDTAHIQQREGVSPVVRKSRFVMACLAFHAVITLLFFPGLGHHVIGTLFGSIYIAYFVYTSIPSVFVGQLLPDNVRSSDGYTILLLINGVIVVWLTANWMHDLFARSENNASEP